MNSINHRQSPDITEIIAQLWRMSETLSGQTEGVAKRFCQEIMRVTQKRVRLSLSDEKLEAPFPAIVTFPVQFANRSYGTLALITQTTHVAAPPLSLADIELLAHTCGGILHLLELSILTRPHEQRHLSHKVKLFSNKELNVLQLMARSSSNEEIAEAFRMTLTTVKRHRQDIYYKLEAHTERDAILMAYHAGLFSPLDEPLAHLSHKELKMK